MYILLDTNIWLSELGLNSPSGAALQHYAHKKGAILAIPEVIRREAEANLISSLKEARHNIKRDHARLLSIFGKLKEIVLPTDQEIEQKSQTIFEDIKIETMHIPFTLKSADHALDAVINGKPPNGPKNQQFKDSVIWADCLDLLSTDEVVLVTLDKGFYENRDYKKGLAKELEKDIENSSHSFKLHSSIKDIISEISHPIEIDKEDIAQQFLNKEKDNINKLLDNNGFVITDNPTVETSAFITESPNTLYVDFSIIYEANDATKSGRHDGSLTIKGECFYHIDSQTFTDFRNKGDELTFTDSGGERQSKNLVIAFGNIVLGHRTVEHSVRYPTENS